MNNKAQFTPLKKAVHVIPMLYAEAFAGSNNKEFVVELYEDARLLETAAPAMYEALQHAAMSYHHPACKCKGEYAANPEKYCSCHIQKAKAALAQAEGRQG